MAVYVSFTPTEVLSRPRHTIEPQGTLFDQLPRGLPIFKEEAEEGEVFKRLANQLPLPTTRLLH